MRIGDHYADELTTALRKRYPDRVRPVGFYPLPSQRVEPGRFAAEYQPRRTARARTRLIYIHVPFCAQRCDFCRFYPGHYVDDAASRYVGTALAQLRLWEDLVGGDRAAGPVEAVFVGGGSPSVLSADQLHDLLTGIRGIMPFVDLPEITVEWYPRDATEEKLAAVRAAGCTRISLGVQTWNADVSAAMGGHHTAEQADAALGMARGAGLRNVNVDLMANIPGQRLDQHLEDVARALVWQPAMISFNALEVAAGTPLAAKAAKTLFTESDEDKRNWLEATRRALFDHGYAHQRVRNFHRPEGLHHYNRRSAGVSFDIVPVGPGAYGYVGGSAVMNELDLRAWTARVEAGGLPVVGRSTPSPEEDRRAFGVSSFLELQFDVDDYRAEFGSDPVVDFPFLAELLDMGALASLGSLLRLRTEAAPFGDDVCGEFHSPAQRALFDRHLSVGRSREASQYFPLTTARPRRAVDGTQIR